MGFAQEMRDFMSALNMGQRYKMMGTEQQYMQLRMQYLQQQIKNYPEEMQWKRMLREQQIQMHNAQMQNMQKRGKYLDNINKRLDQQPTGAPVDDAIGGNGSTTVPLTPTGPRSEADTGDDFASNDQTGNAPEGAIPDQAQTPMRLASLNAVNTGGGAPGVAGTGGGAIDRSWAIPQIQQNPGLIQRMADMVKGEVGLGSDPTHEKIQLETAFNRAQARGISLNQSLLSVRDNPRLGYYASDTYSRPASPSMVDWFKQHILAPVLGGSNTSKQVLGFTATGNASGNFALRRAASGKYYGQTGWYGGKPGQNEMYAVEGADKQWAANIDRGGGTQTAGRGNYQVASNSGSFPALGGAPSTDNPTATRDRRGAVPTPSTQQPNTYDNAQTDKGLSDNSATDPNYDPSTNAGETDTASSDYGYGNSDPYGNAAGDSAAGGDNSLPSNDGPGFDLASNGFTGTAFDSASPAGASFGAFARTGGLVPGYADGGAVEGYYNGPASGSFGAGDQAPGGVGVAPRAPAPSYAQGNAQDDDGDNDTEDSDDNDTNGAIPNSPRAAPASGGGQPAAPVTPQGNGPGFSLIAARDAVASGVADRAENAKPYKVASADGAIPIPEDTAREANREALPVDTAGETSGSGADEEAQTEATQPGALQLVAATRAGRLPQNQVGGMAIPPSPRAQAVHRYGNTYNGQIPDLTAADMQKLQDHVDPDHKMTDAERNMASYSFMQEYYLRKGDPASMQAAKRIAGQMLEYNKVLWNHWMPIANAAAEAGDLQGAATALGKAYAQVPNGTELKFSPGQDGKSLNYQITRMADGQPIHQGTFNVQQLAQMTQQWGGAGAFDHLVKESIQGPAKPDQTVTAKPPTMKELNEGDTALRNAAPPADDNGKTPQTYPQGYEDAGQGIARDILVNSAKSGQGALTAKAAISATTQLLDPNVKPQMVPVPPEQGGGAMLRLPNSQITMRVSQNSLMQLMAIRGQRQSAADNDLANATAPDLGTQQQDFQTADQANAEAKGAYSPQSTKARNDAAYRARWGIPADGRTPWGQ